MRVEGAGGDTWRGAESDEALDTVDGGAEVERASGAIEVERVTTWAVGWSAGGGAGGFGEDVESVTEVGAASGATEAEAGGERGGDCKVIGAGMGARVSGAAVEADVEIKTFGM